MFYSHLDWFSAKSLQVVHKFLQAAWAPAGHAVQIEMVNNPVASTLAASGFSLAVFWELQGLSGGLPLPPE